MNVTFFKSSVQKILHDVTWTSPAHCTSKNEAWQCGLCCMQRTGFITSYWWLQPLHKMKLQPRTNHLVIPWVPLLTWNLLTFSLWIGMSTFEHTVTSQVLILCHKPGFDSLCGLVWPSGCCHVDFSLQSDFRAPETWEKRHLDEASGTSKTFLKEFLQEFLFLLIRDSGFLAGICFGEESPTFLRNLGIP